MGKRKKISADLRKSQNKDVVKAILRNCPSSPRKMRLVADAVRGVEVNKALGILNFATQHAALDVVVLLKSAIANWEQKNSDRSALENGEVYVKTIMVDGGRMLKRISPAPQGRAYRIRKRSNHVTIILDKKINVTVTEK